MKEHGDNKSWGDSKSLGKEVEVVWACNANRGNTQEGGQWK